MAVIYCAIMVIAYVRQWQNLTVLEATRPDVPQQES